jgi:GMP synthase (glutamine-hydrolysing)
MRHDTIAVIDFGGQYAHLIATKLRRLGVHSVITDPQDPCAAYDGLKGIILSGSPALASQGEESDYNQQIYDLDIPLLGLCFGHQQIVQHYGGQVEFAQREYGRADLHRVTASPITEGLADVEQVFMSHGDSVVSLPAGFVEVGYSKLGGAGAEHRYAAVADEARKRYGFQFHPEVDDTVHGDTMLANFALKVCGCERTWQMERFLDEAIAGIRERVGDGSVFLLASGGVDSTVCAWLLTRALGPERLHLLHVDNGLMRLRESAQVIAAFEAHDVSRHVHFVDAEHRFLAAIGDAVEPEAKRLAIGNTFIDVFADEARRLGLDQLLLAQGTIYPDTIETGGTKRADTIKTHHNRVPIIEELIQKGRVIEPLAELYKVEVRELGRTLGVPEPFIVRHPFPGPGLGVRVLCADGPPADQDPAALAAAAGPIAARYGFGALPLPIRSVGVKADLRCYESPILLHAPAWEYEQAELAAGEIFKSVPGVNRCVVALAPASPRRAETVVTPLTRARLDVCRLADDAVMRGLARHDLLQTVWQCPTVLVPVRLDDGDGELVVVRPVLSERAMTARTARLPAALADELRREILAIAGVSALAVDVTSKPPGTIEWE